MNLEKIVSAFVEVMWRRFNLAESSEEEIGALFSLVERAGFSPQKLMIGELKFERHGRDGAAGEVHIANRHCPFKVLGADSLHATRWLNCVAAKAREIRIRSEEQRQRLIVSLVEFVEESAPLKPILLPHAAGKLQEPPPQEFWGPHTRDYHPIGAVAGIHAVCGGRITCRPMSETHRVLLCRRCLFRMEVPVGITTYGQLRQAINEGAAK